MLYNYFTVSDLFMVEVVPGEQKDLDAAGKKGGFKLGTLTMTGMATTTITTATGINTTYWNCRFFAHFEEHLKAVTGMKVEDFFNTEEKIRLVKKCFGR